MAEVHSKRAAGTIYLKANGEMLAARGSFTWQISGEEREYNCNADGSGYWTSKPSPGVIKGNLTDYNETDIEGIRKQEGVSITLELGNGKVISAKDAVQVSPMEVNAETGEVSAEWRSDTVEIVR